jgi:hypothetical protein
MSRAFALAAERTHLRLVRETAEEKIGQAVEALDQRIVATPYQTPISVGVLEKFIDPYGGDRVSYRMRTVGGKDIVILVPIEVDGQTVDLAARELVDTVIGELDTAPADD